VPVLPQDNFFLPCVYAIALPVLPFTRFSSQPMQALAAQNGVCPFTAQNHTVSSSLIVTSPITQHNAHKVTATASCACFSSHPVTQQEEAEQVTRKLRKLWTKYTEAKGELNGAWGDWAAEKEEMLDSVRMLQQQLTLKDLVIQAFIPPQDVQKVGLTACLLGTLLAYYWAPCLPTGYPACLLGTLIPSGYPACLLLGTPLAYWEL